MIEVAPGDGDAFSLSVNGAACKLGTNELLPNGNRWLTYPIPLDALPGRNDDTIMITAAGSSTTKVFRVETRFHPAR
jgi:hypothetical protein